MAKRIQRNTARRAATPRNKRKPECAPRQQRAATDAYRLPATDPSPGIGVAVARLLGTLRPIVAAVNPSRLDWLDALPAPMPAEAVADCVWAGRCIVRLAPPGFPLGRFRADLLRWLELLAGCLDRAAEHRARHPDASWVDALDDSGGGDDAIRAAARLRAGFDDLQRELLELEARAGVAGRDVPWIEPKPAAVTVGRSNATDEASEPRLNKRHTRVAKAMLREHAVMPRSQWAERSGESESTVRAAVDELCRVGWAEKCTSPQGSRLTDQGRKYLKQRIDPKGEA